jgi:hypothetical protein
MRFAQRSTLVLLKGLSNWIGPLGYSHAAVTFIAIELIGHDEDDVLVLAVLVPQVSPFPLLAAFNKVLERCSAYPIAIPDAHDRKWKTPLPNQRVAGGP